MQISVDVSDSKGELIFRSSDSRVIFDGFLKVYRPSSEEEDEATWRIGHGNVLSILSEGQSVLVNEVTPSQHFTAPPFRYTEATLVKSLEERGIGRPSTYATILKVLKVGQIRVLSCSS